MMINKPTGPSTEYIQKIHDYVDVRGTDFNRNNLFRAHTHRGTLLLRLAESEYRLQTETELNGLARKDLCSELASLEYRHECLKSLYEDATNCADPAQAETDIDEFIRDEEPHS